MAQSYRTTISWSEEMQRGLDAYGRRRQIDTTLVVARMMIERGLAVSEIDHEQSIERIAAAHDITYIDALKLVIERGIKTSKE